MKRTALLCLLLFSCTVEPPAPYESPPLLVAQDVLGLLHPEFRVKGAAHVFPKGTPLGILDWTFGSDTAHLELLLSRLNPSFLRIHLINTVCVRNANCGKYEPGFGFTSSAFDNAVRNENPKILGFIRTRTEVYRELSLKYPQTDFYISPALEHDLSIPSWRTLANAVKSIWPEVQLVNCPDGGIFSEHYKGALIERHGDRPQKDADLNSLDGVDYLDPKLDRGAWLRTPGRKLRWTGGYNCRIMGPFIDPRKRHSCSPVTDLERMK